MLLRAPPVNQSQGEANIAIGLSFAYGCLQCSLNFTGSRAFNRLSILMVKACPLGWLLDARKVGKVRKGAENR